MRSYKDILSFLIVREHLSLAWKLAFFVVCGALLYGSLTSRHVRVRSIDVKGTVLKDRSAVKEGASVEYLTVRLESGDTVKATGNRKIDYRPGREVIIKETTASLFGVRKHVFKKYLDEAAPE
jgi:hypothetical protein